MNDMERATVHDRALGGATVGESALNDENTA